MSKKALKRKVTKQRDPPWKLRHAFDRKVEPNPRAYTRKFKIPEEDDED